MVVVYDVAKSSAIREGHSEILNLKTKYVMKEQRQKVINFAKRKRGW